jgi:hypothetical protein
LRSLVGAFRLTRTSFPDAAIALRRQPCDLDVAELRPDADIGVAAVLADTFRAAFLAICSWSVLIMSASVGTAVSVHIDLQTVICQGPSVSCESVAAAKLKQPADASLTIFWHQPKSF